MVYIALRPRFADLSTGNNSHYIALDYLLSKYADRTAWPGYADSSPGGSENRLPLREDYLLMLFVVFHLVHWPLCCSLNLS